MDIFGIVENKVKFQNINRIFENSLANWNLFHNGTVNSTSRVWFCWNPGKATRSMLSSHVQAISCFIEHKEHPQNFALTMVFGKNKVEERRSLWAYLGSAKNSIGTLPWIVMGDFNTVRDPAERLGSDDVDHLSILEFNKWIEEADLEEHPGRGFFLHLVHQGSRRRLKLYRIDNFC